MRKIYLLLLIFFVFSCKTEQTKGKASGDPGSSQLDLTKEQNQAPADRGVSDETSADEPNADATSDGSSTDGSPADVSSVDGNALVQDGSDIAETPETKTDDLQADAQNDEQKIAAEAVDEKKETPGEVKPPAPAIAAVQPPPAPSSVQPVPVQPPPAAKEEPPAAQTPATGAPASDKPADEKQDAPDDSETPPPPPRYQPWITPPPTVSAVKDDAPVPNKQVLIPPKEDNVFSRVVRATVGQLVEIPFRGNNWSYLEDMVSRRGIAYMSRRNDPEGMTFTFRAEDTGIFALRFYRRDYIRDYILYDYVQVIVDEQPNKGSVGVVNPSVDRGKVTAEPRWPSALEEASMLRGGARPASGSTDGSSASPPASSANRDTPSQAAPVNRDASSQPQGTSTAPPVTSAQAATPQVVSPQALTQQPVTPAALPAESPAVTAPPAEKREKLPPEEILKKAQDAFTGGKAAEAIALLDQYTEDYPGGNDELYWMYGQFYEANTSSRNILLSLDYYRRLVNEYPQSMRYNDARRRISYLERFYVNIQ